MKYPVITLLVLLMPIFHHAQNKILHIEYDYFFKDYFPEIRHLDLASNNKESLSTITKTIMYRAYGAIEASPKTTYESIFKTRDSIISKDIEVQAKEYFIKEPSPQFNWQLTGRTKTILDQLCQEATTSFRGRNYIAYFSSKIPFRAAPLKFDGLPGVVLALYTDDNKIAIDAKSIAIKNFNGPIAYPFTEGSETITWEIFVEKYKQSWEKHKNKVGSQIQSIGSSSTMTMGIPKVSPGLRMEIIVEGN
ncbi:GLPGLI family protein [Maribacter confluentis]|uniref:GLPGLI family protein n=2 Tax=Maribacter confluentis TaxID=1656093 RepID=A0ABT8RRC8_9FLAO|nr:GLPGLI family protein [Maribacter confluentis]MDO1513476.1 GLPGLI family protein [Maribacter confluentis]